MREQKEAINLNQHIHLGSCVKIPKYFKDSKYFQNFKVVNMQFFNAFQVRGSFLYPIEMKHRIDTGSNSK